MAPLFTIGKARVNRLTNLLENGEMNKMQHT